MKNRNSTAILQNTKKNKWNKARKTFLAIAFLLPAIILFSYFIYWPVFNTVRISFFKYNIVDSSKNLFVGFQNYANTLQSELFWVSLKNALILYLFSLLFGFWVPIAQALAITELVRGKGIARLCYLLPTALSSFAGMSVWKYIWEPDGGLANIFLSWFGAGPYQWYGSEELVKFCLRFPAILGGGGSVVIFAVAMSNIPAELYEAAKIDGANAFQRIRHITLPGIRYTVFIMFIMSMSTSLLAFDDVYMVTQGGPGYSSFTAVLGVFTKAFRENNYGMASAMSVVICLITLIITIISFTIQGKLDDDYS